MKLNKNKNNLKNIIKNINKIIKIQFYNIKNFIKTKCKLKMNN